MSMMITFLPFPLFLRVLLTQLKQERDRLNEINFQLSTFHPSGKVVAIRKFIFGKDPFSKVLRDWHHR
uniref:Putative secreted protein n=1 Tax=Anopheles marajoara TaxID=58244 RepID=A0A2M4CFA7_9DIPT